MSTGAIHTQPHDVAGGNIAVDVRQALLARKAGKTWRALKIELGINQGTLAAVAKGARRPPLALYIALGLTPPVRLVEVPEGYGVGRACVVCGQVHTTATCPTKRKPRRAYRGMVTRVSASVNCVRCGAYARTDERTRPAAGKWFLEIGWSFTDAGPVCSKCSAEATAS